MKKAVIPTLSQLKRTRIQIIKNLYDKEAGYNLAYFTRLFGITKKTTMTMWAEIRKEREQQEVSNNDQSIS